MVFFSKRAGRFFNGAEAELRRDGVAVFCVAVRFLPVFSCGALLIFILVFALVVVLVWRCFCTRQLNRPCFFFIMVH